MVRLVTHLPKSEDASMHMCMLAPPFLLFRRPSRNLPTYLLTASMVRRSLLCLVHQVPGGERPIDGDKELHQRASNSRTLPDHSPSWRSTSSDSGAGLEVS